MSPNCDVAIIGAGPHGLSLAAHLAAAGIDFRIFGRPLGTWRDHMPRNMMLKSDGFASNLSAPSPDSTFKAWCARHRVPYADQGLPISLDDFLSYGADFHNRFVPGLENLLVTQVERESRGFVLTLENGEQTFARHLVVATGISCFAYTPPALSRLPSGMISHSYEHRDVEAFRGRDTVVIGAGASAIDLASLLADCGAHVRIVARTSAIEYNSVPDPDAQTLVYRLRRPASGIGRGWSSYFCASAPLLFYRLPEPIRRRGVRSHMHPAAGWFMRERIESRVETLLGRKIEGASERGGRAELKLLDGNGRRESICCDHVVAATGYRPDTRSLTFLGPELRSCMASQTHTPVVSDNFETPVEGLYVVGPAIIDSFGPLMRFMVGAEFVAPRLAAHLTRKFGVRSERSAA